MNNVFKKAGKERIQIDNNYFLETDGFKRNRKTIFKLYKNNPKRICFKA